MRRVLVGFTIAATLFVLAAPAAMAQDDVMREVNALMEDSSDWLDENTTIEVGSGIYFNPEIGIKFAYNDNIYLNDKEEDPDTFRDPEAITRGRVSDFIINFLVHLSFDMEVNPHYTRIFEHSNVTILSYDLDYQWYANESDLNFANQRLRSDLFFFLKDIFNTTIIGPDTFITLGGDWSEVQDPLEVLVRDLRLPGAPIVDDVTQLRRQVLNLYGSVGYQGNMFRTDLGYDYYRMEFEEGVFSQADHTTQTGTWDIRVVPPFMGRDQWLYTRLKYQRYDFPTEREVVPGQGSVKLMNDANVYDAVIGFEGPLFSQRTRWMAEVGYTYWDTVQNGVIQDDSDFQGGTGLLRVIYTLPKSSNTVQFEASRFVTWSVIANYSLEYTVAGTYNHNLMPNRMDADVLVAWNHSNPSAPNTPTRSLFEIGAGLVWHAIPSKKRTRPQLDIELRYRYMTQTASGETSFFIRDPGTGDIVEVKSSLDFYQNLLTLGFYFKF